MCRWSLPRYRPPTHTRYNKLCGSLRSLIHRISLLPADDPFRQQKEAEMLNKLYDMGILDVGSKPSDIENKVTVSSIARRRLAVVVARLKMSETVSDVSPSLYPLAPSPYSSQAVRTIEQGHIRVGTQPVTDPAMLITRHMEDFVTWVDTSARKRTIMKYNDEVGLVWFDSRRCVVVADDSSMTLICCNGVVYGHVYFWVLLLCGRGRSQLTR